MTGSERLEEHSHEEKKLKNILTRLKKIKNAAQSMPKGKKKNQPLVF